MRNNFRLVQRIAAIALCVCLTQSVHYSQTAIKGSAPEVVRLRAKFEIKKPRHVMFSPVSKLLAVRREDGSIQIVDVTDGSEQCVLPLSDKDVFGMEWTRDGQRLLVIAKKSAALWDARRGTRISAPVDYRHYDHWALSPDEKSFLSVRERNSIKAALIEKDNARAQVWDLETGRMRFEVKINGLFGYAQFSPDSKLLLTTSASDDPKLWDVETGRLFATLKRSPPSVLCGGAGAQFSPDGKFVVVQRPHCGSSIWESATAVLKNEVTLTKDDTASILQGFSPDGKTFTIARQRLKGWSILTSIELRDCETGELRATFTDRKWEDWPQSVLWSNDGRTLVATSGHKYKGRIWDASTGRLRGTIPMVLTYSRIPFDWGFKDRDELSLHPTLPIISAASNKFIRLWNAETGELMQTLENTDVRSEWSADGKLLVTFTNDRPRIFVWDVVGPESMTSYRLNGNSLIQ